MNRCPARRVAPPANECCRTRSTIRRFNFGSSIITATPSTTRAGRLAPINDEVASCAIGGCRGSFGETRAHRTSKPGSTSFPCERDRRDRRFRHDVSRRAPGRTMPRSRATISRARWTRYSMDFTEQQSAALAADCDIPSTAVSINASRKWLGSAAIARARALNSSRAISSSSGDALSSLTSSAALAWHDP